MRGGAGRGGGQHGRQDHQHHRQIRGCHCVGINLNFSLMPYGKVLDLGGGENSATDREYKEGVDIELAGVCRILGAEVV